MIYTKEEFKRRYDNDEYLDLADIWDCAAAWGLYIFPRNYNVFQVITKVLKACGVK